MSFKPTQHSIAAAIIIFFSIQAMGECIPAPPTTAVSNFRSCTTTWVPIPNSCDTMGTWESPNIAYEGICTRRGCSVKNPGSGSTYCGGTPCCNTSNTSNSLICRALTVCACISGYEEINGNCVMSCGPGTKRVGGECRKIICPGGRVSGEQWSYQIPHGHKYYMCEVGGKVEEWVLCDNGFIYDGARACFTTIP